MLRLWCGTGAMQRCARKEAMCRARQDKGGLTGKRSAGPFWMSRPVKSQFSSVPAIVTVPRGPVNPPRPPRPPPLPPLPDMLSQSAYVDLVFGELQFGIVGRRV
jgi:hypothetical protein